MNEIITGSIGFILGGLKMCLRPAIDWYNRGKFSKQALKNDIFKRICLEKWINRETTGNDFILIFTLNKMYIIIDEQNPKSTILPYTDYEYTNGKYYANIDIRNNSEFKTLLRELEISELLKCERYENEKIMPNNTYNSLPLHRSNRYTINSKFIKKIIKEYKKTK